MDENENNNNPFKEYSSGECWVVFFVALMACFFASQIFPLLGDWVFHITRNVYQFWKGVSFLIKYYMIFPLGVWGVYRLIVNLSKATESRIKEEEAEKAEKKRALDKIELLENEAYRDRRRIAELIERIKEFQEKTEIPKNSVLVTTAEKTLDEAVKELSPGGAHE